jgi:hypothetical protein
MEEVMTGPWIKLWRNTLADEKVAFLMRRYGHEIFTLWVGILSQAEEGVLMMDEDVFADLVQIEEKRYLELRGILLKRGMVIENEAGRLEIPNWDEYQTGESTERVRAYRERKKAEALQKRPCNEMKRVEVEEEVELEEEKNSHTPRENETEPSPDPVPLDTLPGSEYSKALYLAWSKLEDKVYQPPNEIHWLNSTFPKSRPHFRGIHSSDVLQAIANFGEILTAPPGKYFWNQRVSFEAWSERHLSRFLPANFKPDDYLVRESKAPRREEPYRQPLVSTYEPIPEENFRPPTEEEQAEVARMMEAAAEKSPAGAMLGRALVLHAHKRQSA